MRRRLLLAALAATALLAPALGHAQEEGGGSKQKASYLSLKAVTVSIVRADGRRGVLTVEVGLDVPNPALRDEVDLYLPLLNSAFVSALQPYAVGLSPAQPPNADYISMVLQRATDQTLKRRGERLLLGSILTN